MLAQGIELMLVGMGTVFAFLLLMVFAMNASGFIIQRYFPPPPEPLTSRGGAADAEIAVVLAAASRWRDEHGGN